MPERKTHAWPLPVLVFCPWWGEWTAPAPATMVDFVPRTAAQLLPVGRLSGYACAIDADLDKVRAALSKHDVTVAFVTCGESVDGTSSVLVGAGVICKNLEHARSLPGFDPMFCYSGPMG